MCYCSKSTDPFILKARANPLYYRATTLIPGAELLVRHCLSYYSIARSVTLSQVGPAARIAYPIAITVWSL